MQKFSISRIHTKLGIFRLSGLFEVNLAKVNIKYSLAEFMGTDGWCELDLDSENAQILLSNIESEVIEHLS